MGKTALITKLDSDTRLKKWPIAVVSADSVQAYRELNIGTAKPSFEERKKIAHFLIDILDIKESYSLGSFLSLADEICSKQCASGVLPILTGGTAYYIKAFMHGLVNTPSADLLVREKIKQEILEEGLDEMYKKLLLIDPVYASKISSHDSYRIARALEVYRVSGKPLSSYEPVKSKRDKWDCLLIGLDKPRTELYSKINKRVEAMFDAGLAEEAKALIAKGYKKSDPGLKAIGYSEFFSSTDDLTIKETIKKHTRQYAKRQLTFMRALPEINWFNVDDYDSIIRCIISWLKK